MKGRMISKVLKLVENDIWQFSLKRTYLSDDEIKRDYLKLDWTRYSFSFCLEKNPFEQICLERLEELGIYEAESWYDIIYAPPSIVEPLYSGNGLPDNFYPFGFGEIITPDVHLYRASIKSMVSLKVDGDYERIISGDCLMDNKRFCK